MGRCILSSCDRMAHPPHPPSCAFVSPQLTQAELLCKIHPLSFLFLCSSQSSLPLHDLQCLLFSTVVVFVFIFLALFIHRVIHKCLVICCLTLKLGCYSSAYESLALSFHVRKLPANSTLLSAYKRGMLCSVKCPFLHKLR